jgi:1-acyl-sn-glycerol-3-phosphate acyltransferase
MVRVLLGILGLIWKLYIALIFTATALVLYPIIVAFLYSKNGKRRAFKVFIFWSWLFRILCLYGVRKVQNAELPKGGYLIIANHSSYLDIFLMYSIMPNHPFLFLGKSELLSYPLIKTYFKKMNIPVYRNNKVKAARSLIHAAKEVQQGWSIMIFPEGGIPDEEHPKMIPFKYGAFKLAKSLGVPIVPITFTNNYRLFSDPTEILGPAGPGISKVHIHPYITVEEIQELTQTELKNKCFDIINAPILEDHPEFRQ